MIDTETTALPPFGEVDQPAGGLTCNAGTDAAMCGAPATWHIIWTPEGDNGLSCDAHMTDAERRWSWYDRHPTNGVCNMPDTSVVWSWVEAPGKCVWLLDDDDLVTAANEDVPASPPLIAAEILADRAAYYQQRARIARPGRFTADSHWIATQLHKLAQVEADDRTTGKAHE